MDCKNCGCNFDAERIVPTVENEIRKLERQVEYLKEKLRIFKNGFCGSYCEMQYNEDD